MTTYSLDGDETYEKCTLGGIEFVVGDALPPSKREHVKERIKKIDAKNMRAEWISIAYMILSHTNDDTHVFDEDKVTDSELVQFAVLVGRIVWG